MKSIRNNDGTWHLEDCISFSCQGCGKSEAQVRKTKARILREIASGKRKLKKKVVKPDPDFKPEIQELLGRKWC